METKKLEIYKCPVCDTVVEILDPCGVELVCCGPAMIRMQERIAGLRRDEHAPVVQRTAGGFLVRVGRAPHCMTEGHHVEWIELVVDGNCYRQFCWPGEAAEASFRVQADQAFARIYCNVHGLWRSSGETRPGRSPLTQAATMGGSA